MTVLLVFFSLCMMPLIIENTLTEWLGIRRVTTDEISEVGIIFVCYTHSLVVSLCY